MKTNIRILGILAFSCVPIFMQADQKKCYKVTTTKDHGHGSLRHAIKRANKCGKPSTIKFCILKDDKGYNPCLKSWCIKLCKELPVITCQVCIDGYTQACAAPNTNSMEQENNARISIELCGPGIAQATALGWKGLVFGECSDGSTVKGLAINDFPVGIEIGTSQIRILGCFFGVAIDGYTTQANLVSLYITDKAQNTIIGDGTPEGRNLIGGLGRGPRLLSEAADMLTTESDVLGALTNYGYSTSIKGCTLNLARSGDSIITSGAQVGIVSFGAAETQIGGPSLNCRVVVAGHRYANIYFDTTINDIVQNVFTGTDILGMQGLGGGIGIMFRNRHVHEAAAEGELLHLVEDCVTSSHSGSGLVIGTLEDSAPVCYVNINRTKSGTDISGTRRLPNDEHGISIGYGKDINICECIFNYNHTHGVFGPRMKRTIIKDSDVSFNEVDGLNYVPEGCVLEELSTRVASLSVITGVSGFSSIAAGCPCTSTICACYFVDACGNRICC